MVDFQPYNLTLLLFRDKTLKQTLDLTCELGIVEQNSLTPNSRICEALEPYGQVYSENNNIIRSLKAKNLKCIWRACTMRSSNID